MGSAKFVDHQWMKSCDGGRRERRVDQIAVMVGEYCVAIFHTLQTRKKHLWLLLHTATRIMNVGVLRWGEVVLLR